MTTMNIVLLVACAVLLVAYMMRRRARLRSED